MGLWNKILDKVYDFRGGNKKSTLQEIKNFSSKFTLVFTFLAILGLVVLPLSLEFATYILFLAIICFINIRHADLTENLKRRIENAK